MVIGKDDAPLAVPLVLLVEARQEAVKGLLLTQNAGEREHGDHHARASRNLAKAAHALHVVKDVFGLHLYGYGAYAKGLFECPYALCVLLGKVDPRDLKIAYARVDQGAIGCRKISFLLLANRKGLYPDRNDASVLVVFSKSSVSVFPSKVKVMTLAPLSTLPST